MEFAEGFVAVAIAAAVRLAVLAGFDFRHRGLRTSCRSAFGRCALGRSVGRLVAGLGLARLRCVGRRARALAGCGLQCGKRVRLRRTGFRCGGGEDKRLNDRDGGRLRAVTAGVAALTNMASSAAV